MEHGQAKAIADKWVDLLLPSCERVEIAGSVRRGKYEVKDIELLAVPKVKIFPDIWGKPGTQINLLEARINTLFMERAYLAATKRGPRYKQLVLLEGIHLDLFIVQPPAEWGVQKLIRTGPADFSQFCVTQKNKGGALPSYLHVKDGAIWHRSKKIETPEEEDVFRILGMEYIEPKDRRAQWRVEA
jgi:DNA polymerase/3'-5' exonuclease PolX